MKAVIAYQKRLNSSKSVPAGPVILDQEMEKKRKVILRSFSLARNIYTTGRGTLPWKESELQAGAEFLEVLYRHIYISKKPVMSSFLEFISSKSSFCFFVSRIKSSCRCLLYFNLLSFNFGLSTCSYFLHLSCSQTQR